MNTKGANSFRESYLENDFVEFWIEDGVVMQIFKPHVTKVTLPMAREIVRDRLRVSDRTTRPLFVDANNAMNMDKEARDFFVTSEAVQFISASAFLVHSYIALMSAKLFVSFTKSPVKTEFFKVKSKALQWLEHYKNLN